MSKMDELRALREARYERTLARAAAARPDAPKAATKPRAPAVSKPSAGKPAAAPSPASGAEAELCGHRSMNGRTCTREHGHAAKSHRYS